MYHMIVQLIFLGYVCGSHREVLCRWICRLAICVPAALVWPVPGSIPAPLVYSLAALPFLVAKATEVGQGFKATQLREHVSTKKADIFIDPHFVNRGIFISTGNHNYNLSILNFVKGLTWKFLTFESCHTDRQNIFWKYLQISSRFYLSKF